MFCVIAVLVTYVVSVYVVHVFGASIHIVAVAMGAVPIVSIVAAWIFIRLWNVHAVSGTFVNLYVFVLSGLIGGRHLFKSKELHIYDTLSSFRLLSLTNECYGVVDQARYVLLICTD